ncbi:16638_t:CDS:1 [Gigaspora margarita]|uniref:16638_t:CDS:1 n=1 Tax=Gigaspora margarita TaxID=4874 RepID=A0ABN7UR22_GIGMA|nr:16638_t:CDS:1 [Gigaspora margarita]
MSDNREPTLKNTIKKLDWFSYLFSEDVNITADEQGFNFSYPIRNIDNPFKQAIEQKKSHCRLNKVNFTFIPTMEFDYRTLTFNGSPNEITKDKNKLNTYNNCYVSTNGGISQRRVLVEKDFRRSESQCNQERTYILYSVSDNFEDIIENLEDRRVGVLKIDYYYEYFNRVIVT